MSVLKVMFFRVSQVKSPRAIELDKLVERMTAFYSEESNRDMYKLKKVLLPVQMPSKLKLEKLKS